jgi:hypothetical protein
MPSLASAMVIARPIPFVAAVISAFFIFIIYSLVCYNNTNVIWIGTALL